MQKELSTDVKFLGTPSQAKISGAEMTKDDTGIILKWKLESYSPITEYKVNIVRDVHRKNVNVYKLHMSNELYNTCMKYYFSTCS